MQGLTLTAPAHWACVDVMSDLHLQASEPDTAAAWEQHLLSTPADAVFILGDLFEVWVGDDVLSDPAQPAGFEAACVKALRSAAQHRSIFFLHGNRDFLIGPAFAQAASLSLLADPTLLEFGGKRWLLSHGDALCLDDTDYQHFRAEVRSATWQQAFLAQPLADRKAMARSLREQSQARQRSALHYADLHHGATLDWLAQHRASVLIHGHTHRPGDHALGPGSSRMVLSDWDLNATSPRAEVLRLRLPDGQQSGAAVQLQRIGVGAAA